MRRRITEAIVGVAALILAVLGLPLAVVVHQSILDSEVVELQATAARTLTEIEVPLDVTQLAAVSSEPDAPPPFSIYGTDGTRLFGTGPATADSAVRRALAGDQASTTDGEIVVATPITDDSSERIVGALRLTESLAGTNHRSRVAWLEMICIALAALVLGWLVAKRLARRLSQPVSDLATAAARVGDGGSFVPPASPSGIREIDSLSAALADSSQRVNDTLAREKRFSSDVSHQLRTPLTRIRLRLENMEQHDPAQLELVLDDLARLEHTIDHLLTLARDEIPATSTVELDHAAQQAVQRWIDRVSGVGRSLTLVTTSAVIARGSARSVDQILDVLIDNALHHGEGDITISPRRLPGGGAVDITDLGGHIAESEADLIFERGHGRRSGIGLALARSIAEAEGGRLLLTHRTPTTFSLILLEPAQTDER